MANKVPAAATPAAKKSKYSAQAIAPKTIAKPRKPRVRKSVVRDARLDVRLSKAAKERIETAAALSCQTLGEYVSSVLLRESEQVIERNRVITLSEKHWKQLLQGLDNPPELSGFVQRGLDNYRQNARTQGEVTVLAGSLLNDGEVIGDPH